MFNDTHGKDSVKLVRRQRNVFCDSFVYRDFDALMLGQLGSYSPGLVPWFYADSFEA